jgi:hypothetical protein
MLFSPEVDARKAHRKAIILRDAKGFFDDLKEREDLQISVRISCERFVFLKLSNDIPEVGEADSMAGTIGAGLDWFFSMTQTGAILIGLKLQRGFGPKLPITFLEPKASYDSVFHQVLESTRSIKAIGLLLSLVQMMFLFMTIYFPSFLSFSGESGSAQAVVTGGQVPIGPPYRSVAEEQYRSIFGPQGGTEHVLCCIYLDRSTKNSIG